VADLVLVRSLRTTLTAVFLLPVVLFAEEPKVTAPISAEDVQQICKLVRSVTTEPIGTISEVTTQEYIAGVPTRQDWLIPEKGEGRYVTVYFRRDRVWVFTRPERKDLLPMMIHLQTTDAEWKITKKSRMVE
jgi:hypothetical protein